MNRGSIGYTRRGPAVLFLLVFAAFLASPAAGTLLFYEGFDYSAGALTAVSGDWLNQSGATEEYNVLAGGSLSYSGLAPSLGNRVEHTGSESEDVRRTFTPVIPEGGVDKTVYYSLLINVSSLATPSYFAHFFLGTAGYGFCARLYVQDDGGGNAQFGISWASDDASGIYAPGTYSTSTTHLLVVKLTMKDGLDDTVDLYINPTPGAAEPGASDAQVGSGGNDITSAGIGALGLRQDWDFGTAEIDEIRVGTAWGDVTPVTATKADLLDAYSFDGNIVAVFNIDPGAVTAGSFSLTGSQTLSFTGISGTGTDRVLDPSAALAGDDVLDNLAVAGTGTTNAGNVDFYVYPPIRLTQDGTISGGTLVGIKATVTGVVSPTPEGSGWHYSVADASGAWNGIMVFDTVNSPTIYDDVELAGTVTEAYNVTTLAVASYLNLGAGTPIAPTMVTPADFRRTAGANALPNEQYEGVLIGINGLTNARDIGYGETAFDENVALDGLFYDARGQGDIVDGNDYNVFGIGIYTYSAWKILPRGSADIILIGDTSPPTVKLAFATGPDKISILFSEAVGEATAETVTNYELIEVPSTSRGNPTSAVLQTFGGLINKRVELTFPPSTVVSQGIYYVKVSNIEDTKGNAMVATADSNDLYGGIQPISWAAAQTNDVPDRDPDVCVTVVGTITSVDHYGNVDIYLQDETGGIQDRDFSVDSVIDGLELNDVILAAGFADEFMGKAQLDADDATTTYNPVTIELSDETGSVTPRTVTVSELGESTENLLIQIVGATIDPGGHTNFGYNSIYSIDDGTDSISMWIDGNTNIPGQPIPTEPVNIRGIGSQFNVAGPLTGYQIAPRFIDDIGAPLFEPATGIENWEQHR